MGGSDLVERFKREAKAAAAVTRRGVAAIVDFDEDPEAVLLVVLLLSGFVIVAFLGKMLAPLLASIVIAYLLEASVTYLESRGLKRLLAVCLVFSIAPKNPEIAAELTELLAALVLEANPDFGKALVGAWYETMALMAKDDALGKEARRFMGEQSGTDLAGTVWYRWQLAEDLLAGPWSTRISTLAARRKSPGSPMTSPCSSSRNPSAAPRSPRRRGRDRRWRNNPHI